MAAWEFQTLQNIAETHGWHKFVSMQNYYNLLYREEGLFYHPNIPKSTSNALDLQSAK
jgi:aryl-alcohol dehydrogenase-like predicted oxidoreductase